MTRREAELHLLPTAFGNHVRPDGWLDEVLELALRLADFDPAAAMERLDRMYCADGLTEREYQVFLEQLHLRLREGGRRAA
ncbi:hypothetical protein [Paludisphaera rhizosphaerae]|uniref:hypothetical protein n=1 Tax=Paludisphaera rhizosphaerae TaxID=2711216 RepID=UPI0013EBB3DD|nr:hypothetical protein [Paludisphaera rhizosphaerae]